MNEVIAAHIDVSTPSGRKIVKELDGKKAVRMEYPLPEEISGIYTRTVDEAFDDLDKRLDDYYSDL